MSSLSQTPKGLKTKSGFRVSVCKNCLKPGHTRMTCTDLPKATLKTTKPMNKIGRVGKETAKAVSKWKQQQKPNHEGYYTCYMCGKWITYLEAEHVKSKARNPNLRTDPTNFKPTCADCNRRKGSKDN